MKSFTDEMEARVVSKRGPYDLFTGERNKPIAVGYFALPVRGYERKFAAVAAACNMLNTYYILDCTIFFIMLPLLYSSPLTVQNYVYFPN